MKDNGSKLTLVDVENFTVNDFRLGSKMIFGK